MKHIYSYILALLMTEGKFSCHKSACKLENISHDKLTRFLSNNDEKSELEIKSLPKGGRLIFDDTSISKKFSKNIEGVRFVWCSSLNKAVRGYTLIKIIYVYGNKIYNLTNLDRNIKSHSGWRIYRKRWIIETIFRNLKSYLHLEQCSARSLKAQINHIQVGMDAFLFLKNKYPDKSIETARQDYLKNVHSENINIIKDLPYAA